MKIIVFAHRLEVGGTQTNAIDLAAALRDLHGFDVTLFATPGPMLRLAEARNLRFVPAPDAYRHPSKARMHALAELVRREKPDLIHAWDWWQMLDALYSVHLGSGVPLVVSDMMMELTRILPKHLPTTFGVPKLVDEARRRGRTRVELLLPPVDVSRNSSNAVDGAAFRQQFNCRQDETTFVTVSRLASNLKSESLGRSIDAVRLLGKELPLRLIIVGEGAARAELARRVDIVNTELGRQAVVLTGAFLDPRAAYAAADIVIGMGGSALRGMAFGKPVIVVGERAFAEVFDQTTEQQFYGQGMYGIGRGAEDEHRLAQCMQVLASQPDRLAELGRFGRQFVVEHFSLQEISARLADFCRSAVECPVPRRRSLLDGLRTAAIYLRERRFLTPSRDRATKDEISDMERADAADAAERVRT